MTNLEDFLNEEFELGELIKSFKRRKFHSAEIELTNACTLSCNYCLASSVSHNNPQRNRLFLSSSVVKSLIDDLIKYGIRTFWWSGGDPLLHKNWYDILKYAKDKGAKENLIFTNGVLLTKKICRKIKNVVDRINFHLDTICQDDFKELQIDSNCDVKHRQAVSGLDNLLETGFDPQKVRWNITLTKASFRKVFDTMNYAIKQKGIKTITLIPLFKSGRGSEVYEKEKLSKIDLRKAYEWRAKIENRPFLLKLGPSEYCKQFTLTAFSIKPHGDVLPYVDYPFPQGNIFNEKISQILKNSFCDLAFCELVSEDTLQNKFKGKCKFCENHRYCFGNPTGTYNNGGSTFESDPLCWEATTRNDDE